MPKTQRARTQAACPERPPPPTACASPAAPPERANGGWQSPPHCGECATLHSCNALFTSPLSPRLPLTKGVAAAPLSLCPCPYMILSLPPVSLLLQQPVKPLLLCPFPFPAVDVGHRFRIYCRASIRGPVGATKRMLEKSTVNLLPLSLSHAQAPTDACVWTGGGGGEGQGVVARVRAIQEEHRRPCRPRALLLSARARPLCRMPQQYGP